jgi:hypothetical protein
MTDTYPDFEAHVLEDGHRFFVGRLPAELCPAESGFEALRDLHPNDYHVIKIHGRPVKTPRWQQAYGADYHYTGRPLHRAAQGQHQEHGAWGSNRDRFPRRGADLSTDSFQKKVKRDSLAEAGTVFIMPYDTNRAWKHSVPKLARYRGRRISTTLRAFRS